ncbi:EAL domain-containing protein [Colwellia psychrerythraea]|uniref:Response regulator receiver modulated diguanylate phosphodiesterase n=1 Tax=Colwellia psychrerythraea TaxID=28229 RepID=A0A099KNH7_COLPS|nr:EAL domain-containing response regulator [Colwellia psychrerythraea]KGJ91785.1 response regulator receiver modulated diguanylate phosphodiesterase [Colwellia psychrerythraea]
MNKLNILVVDDSDVQRNHVMTMCLEQGVADVVGAINGVDAIEKLSEDKFDLVFIDLEMPIMDGVELSRKIAKDKLAKSVIILSSKDPSLISSIGTMAESDGLIVLGTFKKPMQINDLENSLNRLASNTNTNESHKIYNRLEIDDLISGIQKKQITLYYQPKLTSKGLLLKGVEALARWNHPKLGFVSPVEFITAAEEFGIISELTHYLFDIALKQKVQWRDHGINFHLAFNLSPLSLADSDLADKISSQVELHQIEPKDIVLEVTENAICGEISTAIETLAKLRLKGFKLAIDDYGTGFANAQQLSRVPATELKLDRILVDNVATRPQQLAILKSTVNLAKDLGLTTVAEGVENFDDFKLLFQLKVDLIQGYYFAKPMDAKALIHWIQVDLAKIRKDLHEKQAHESGN